MAIDGVMKMAAELRRRGATPPHSGAIATHFSHNGNMLREELVQTFLPHHIDVAYDGIMSSV